MRREPFGRLGLALQAYLKTRGWSVIVVGNPRIEKPGGSLEFNYEFVLPFTGGEKKKTVASPAGVAVNVVENR